MGTLAVASGFNAFGKPVPTERACTALEVAVEEFGCEAPMADRVITTACRYIEADDINEAMAWLVCLTDLTGAYRLLATLCTDGE